MHILAKTTCGAKYVENFNWYFQQNESVIDLWLWCKTAIMDKEEKEMKAWELEWHQDQAGWVFLLDGHLFLAPIVRYVVVATQTAYDWVNAARDFPV